MQNQLGYSALEAGVRFLPISLLSFVVAPISGKLAERVGVRWFIGAGLVCVGLALLLFGGLKVSDDWTALLPGMILGGIGIGMVNAPLATTAVGVVEPQRRRHGLRHQLDRAPGRHRDGYRALRRDRRGRDRRARPGASGKPSAARRRATRRARSRTSSSSAPTSSSASRPSSRAARPSSTA